MSADIGTLQLSPADRTQTNTDASGVTGLMGKRTPGSRVDRAH